MKDRGGGEREGNGGGHNMASLAQLSKIVYLVYLPLILLLYG